MAQARGWEVEGLNNNHTGARPPSPCGVPKCIAVCTICQGPLAEKGPSINSFSFGQLFKRGPKSVSDRTLLLKEFPGSNGGRRRYDTSKTLATPCGHLFHSGCIREWFFVQRDSGLAPLAACPFCQQQVTLANCRIVFPSTVEWESMFKVETKSIGIGTSDERTGNSICKCMNSKLMIAAGVAFPFVCLINWMSHSKFVLPIFNVGCSQEDSIKEFENDQNHVKKKQVAVLDKYFETEFDASWFLTALGIVVGTFWCILRASRNPSNRGLIKAIIAIGLFLFSIGLTFLDDLGLFDFGKGRPEAEEDENIDTDTFEKKIYTWPLIIGGSCFLAALADVFL